jgi:hypothetical protein
MSTFSARLATLESLGIRPKTRIAVARLLVLSPVHFEVSARPALSESVEPGNGMGPAAQPHSPAAASRARYPAAARLDWVAVAPALSTATPEVGAPTVQTVGSQQ